MASAIAWRSSSSSALGVVLAELLLDRLQLLAQHVLALALVELALRLLADLARQLQHLDAVRQELDDAIEPVANLQRFENRLLLGRLDVDEPADHVGERARRLDVLQRRRELGRHLRQQLDGLDGLLLQQRRARLDVGVGRHLIGDQVETRGEERQPVQVVERAKALLALADEVMNAVRRLQVAHDGHRRADAVQIVGPRRVDARVLLQHDAELVAVLHGFLRRAHRKVASQRHLGHGAGEHDDVAHGDDEQHVRGQRHRPVVAGDLRQLVFSSYMVSLAEGDPSGLSGAVPQRVQGCSRHACSAPGGSRFQTLRKRAARSA